MVLVGIIVAKFGNDFAHHSDAGWAAVAFIWIYVGAFGATWGPVSWTFVAEIFPLSIRSKGSSFGASSNWVSAYGGFYSSTNTILGQQLRCRLLRSSYVSNMEMGYIYFLCSLSCG